MTDSASSQVALRPHERRHPQPPAKPEGIQKISFTAYDLKLSINASLAEPKSARRWT